MKCTVERDALAEGVRRVLNVVSSKTTLPVLANVLIEAAEDHLKLTTTDLEVSVTTRVDAIVETAGETTLPAKKFGQIVGSLPSGDVGMVTEEGFHTSISCGQAFFRISGLSADEFPREDELETNWAFSMPAGDMRRAIERVAYAATSEDSRRVLTGILLSLREGVLTSAATDGRRLALVETSLNEDVDSDGDVILPPKLVSELQRTMGTQGDVSVAVSEARISFQFGATHIISKLIEGAYPNYRQVIPETFTMSAVVPREEFLTVLARVGTVLDDSGTVSIELKESTLTVSASSPEFGESSEPMSVSFEGSPVTMAFNPVFVSEPLRHMTADQTIIQINDQFSPIQLSGDEGFLCIIMPMHD